MLCHGRPYRLDMALPLILSLKKISICSSRCGHVAAHLPATVRSPALPSPPCTPALSPASTTPHRWPRRATITQRHQEEVAAGPDFVSYGRPKTPRQEEERPMHAGPFALDIPHGPELAGYHTPPPGRPWPPATLRCFRCFRLMFQVFHLNVAKVDLECYICCKGNICKLQAYVSCISDVCFKSFI
jgi:hypothetical protein